MSQTSGPKDRVSFLLLLLLAIFGLSGLLALMLPARVGRGVNSVADMREHGEVLIHQGTPFCIIYVGLNQSEESAFNGAFWHFADRHGIRKPRKHYTAYSGPPRATAMSDQVALYVRCVPTADIVAQHQAFSRADPEEPPSWQLGIWMNGYWPTNACLIRENGQELLAPYTGSVGMAPYDTNYPAQDFKGLAEALTAAMKSSFPDRAVRVISYYGETR